MNQNQIGDSTMSLMIPVHAIWSSSVKLVPEEIVQIQDVHPVDPCQLFGVVIPFQDIQSQSSAQEIQLRQQEPTADLIINRKGSVPDEEALRWQGFRRCPEGPLQVCLVLAHGGRTVPGHVPQARVHDDNVWFGIFAEIIPDAGHVVVIRSGHKI